MKTSILLLLASTLVAGCATVSHQAPPGVQMSEQERSACAAQGCTVWTEGELQQLARKFFREGWDAAAKIAGKGA